MDGQLKNGAGDKKVQQDLEKLTRENEALTKQLQVCLIDLWSSRRHVYASVNMFMHK